MASIHEHPLASVNAFVSSEFRNKLFRIVPQYPNYGIIVGYVTEERDNGFCYVLTTPLISLRGTYAISVHGLWGKSTFNPNENLDWISTPVILTEYTW